MRRMLLGIFLALAAVAPAAAEQRRNLSMEDVISGFEERKLFYFELILRNGKYAKGFNRCLGSRPAPAEWMRQYCKKNPEFKNAFECSNNQLTHVWFVYENAEQCEVIRGPMKERMDALRE